MILCIDPGHGWDNVWPGRFDPGAVAGSSREADIVLIYGQALRAAAAAAGASVVMTRETADTRRPLVRRVDFARRAGADVFISLHCNAADAEPANGTETLFNVTDALALKVQAAAVGALGLHDRGVKLRPNLAVLKFPGPSCLLELGFISNAYDRAVLLDPSKPARVAAAIVEAIR